MMNVGARGLLVLLMAVGLWPVAAHAAEPGADIRGEGPWRGQIVDADTKQPLEGVVVLAIWNERFGSVGGLAGGGYFDSEEVVTDADGRFTIRRRKTSFNPFSAITGPEFTIFKSGYGQWRFLGERTWPDQDDERRKHIEAAWARFSGEGALLELPFLRTREERQNFFPPMPMPDVPHDRMRRFLEAYDEARKAVGFSPLQSDR